MFVWNTVVPKWCRQHLTHTPGQLSILRFRLTHAECGRVTDGARTRDFL
jgi:hypothetical protein